MLTLHIHQTPSCDCGEYGRSFSFTPATTFLCTKVPGITHNAAIQNVHKDRRGRNQIRPVPGYQAGTTVQSATAPIPFQLLAHSTQCAHVEMLMRVDHQVFLKTQHSFGVVNLKPILPGHVLVCPLQPHRRLTDLSAAETSDLFATVQRVQRMLARVHFKTDRPEDGGSFTVAVQDGPESGQTVPHVHVHVIPRTAGDMGEGKDVDEIYVKMASEEANVGGALWDVVSRPKPGGSMPRVEDVCREAREPADMHAEADTYKKILERM
ncbi:Bis(5'-adenosyl)-triphosphatase [Cordyceps javanica]|uniref:Bis(5'-adenosyl)-triphosphatase n=1 Tax=Cordyceps javanica TaxID=43265 RepID=A0A545VAV0_9HYPO|nr:Bis(5'-adenosyl)-triphosphatase [Cordyceps javanica]